MTRIASMTGFAVAQRATALGTIGVELRSINMCVRVDEHSHNI